LPIQARNLALCSLAFSTLLYLGCKSAGGEGGGQSSAASLSGPPVILPAYQGRAPRNRSSVKNPPSPAVAAALVQCTTDNLSAMGLRLLQDVKVELGAPRPVVLSTDDGLSELDLKSQVYPMRGSYTSYFCRAINNLVPAATICLIVSVPAGKGWCWKTSFGDWKCRFGEIVAADRCGPAPKAISTASRKEDRS
jgi:hypothetical protein